MFRKAAEHVPIVGREASEAVSIGCVPHQMLVVLIPCTDSEEGSCLLCRDLKADVKATATKDKTDEVRRQIDDLDKRIKGCPEEDIKGRQEEKSDKIKVVEDLERAEKGRSSGYR